MSVCKNSGAVCVTDGVNCLMVSVPHRLTEKAALFLFYSVSVYFACSKKCRFVCYSYTIKSEDSAVQEVVTHNKDWVFCKVGVIHRQ